MRSAWLAVLVVLVAAPLWGGVDADKCDVKPRKGVQCPKTTMESDCLDCHVKGDFRVKETAGDAHRVYPFSDMKIIKDGSVSRGYYLLTGIDSKEVKEFFDYLEDHGVKSAIIEVHSPGGSLFDAQKIVSMIQYWQSKGGTVETRLFGAAFSAGFYIFVSGDKRYISEYCDLMWHEIQSFSGFGMKIDTPSDKEEAARILRHLQDVRHKYLSTRGKLTKEQIDKRVSKREWWMSGREAVELGFADGLISGR